ncbi:MAG: lysylphosphatidylglycerol synthase transmembrane domain-containing protein [Chitinophagaceae bacterium]
MNKKEIIKYLIFAAIGVLVVYSIQKGLTFDDLLKNLKEAKVHYVLLSTFVGVLAVLFRALRWQLLLKPMGYETRLDNAYHATMSGYLINLGIPRSGEVARCALFSKTDKVPVNVLVGTVLSERVLDLVMLMIVVFSAVFMQFDLLYGYVYDNVLVKLQSNSLVLIIVVLVLLAGLVVAFKAKSLFSAETKIGKIFLGFFDGIKSIFSLKQPLLFILYTIGIWLCYWMMTYFILQAFDYTEALGLSGGLSALVFSSIGVIIPAPAGSATIYSIYIGLNQIYHLSIDQAKAIGIVMFSSNILMIILAGTISYVILAKRTKA